jgi:transcriptional regulator with XRE-family HTH domain
LYELRLREGLSQAELAKRVHTSPSVISRLEDAEYKGHSLGMLRKIAKALGREVRVVFVEKSAPSKRDAPRASSSRAKRRTPAKRKR